jgi:VanZ family protein
MISLIQSLLKSKYPSIIWTLIIFILCTIPSDEVIKVFTWSDKLNHAIAFAGFTFFWLFRTSLIRFIIILGIFYGIAIEFWQAILPENFHRGFSYLDMVSDAIGCVIGYFLWLIVNWLFDFFETENINSKNGK